MSVVVGILPSIPNMDCFSGIPPELPCNGAIKYKDDNMRDTKNRIGECT